MTIYRIRADLHGATPPVWRRFDLRSNLPLDVVHLVLQTVFDWENRHLYRFALGGRPFEERSQKFLCEEDVAEGEDDGVPAVRVPLDATLRRAGERMTYVYDYGDHWEVTLTTESVAVELGDYPAVVVLDGDGAAPLEDSGSTGMTGPPFDAQRCNNILQGPGFTAITDGVSPDVLGVIGRLRAGPVNSHFAALLPLLGTGPTVMDDTELRTNLAAVQWFLDRAGDGGSR